jgi:hypothetical protein
MDWNSRDKKCTKPYGVVQQLISVRFAHPDHIELNFNGMVGTSDISKRYVQWWKVLKQGIRGLFLVK